MSDEQIIIALIIIIVIYIYFKMVSQPVRVRDKWRGFRKFLKISILLVVVAIVGFAVYYTFTGLVLNKNIPQEIVLENPIKAIILRHADNFSGGVIEINESQINEIVEEAAL